MQGAIAHRWVVVVAALAAFLLRLPGIGEPAGPDEAGFMLVARSWDPQPDSLYGHYFVDRPPFLLLALRLLDGFGGITAVRLLGAVGCAVVVLAAAGAARTVAGDRAVGWVAVSTAAILLNPLIDPVDVKGEVLGLPFLMVSCWITLAALRREDRAGRGAWALALLAGLTGSLAMGLKQSLLGALVFSAVLLIASWATGRITAPSFARLALAGLVGAALHPLATVAWASWAGVDLDTLAYTVIGFRADAQAVLEARPSPANQLRALALLGVAIGTGILPVLATFAVLLPRLWRANTALTLAITAMAAYEAYAIVASGSFWRDYLFALIPVTALAIAAILGALERGALLVPVVVGGIVSSTLVATALWLVVAPDWMSNDEGLQTGRSVAAASRPGDTLTVFGGQADVQLASGLPSPYRHLWSLPMRTLDPDYQDLIDLVEGPDAPTWLVEAADFDVWNAQAGNRLRAAVESRYDATVTVCGNARRVWRLKSADRSAPAPRC